MKKRLVVVVTLLAFFIAGCGHVDNKTDQFNEINEYGQSSDVIEPELIDLSEIEEIKTMDNYILIENLDLENKNSFDDKVEVFYYDKDANQTELPYSTLNITLSDGTIFTKKYDGYFDNHLYLADLNGNGKNEIILFTEWRTNYMCGDVYIYEISNKQLTEWPPVTELNSEYEYVHYNIMDSGIIAKIEVIKLENADLLRTFYYDLNMELLNGMLYADLQWNGSCWNIIRQGIHFSDGTTEYISHKSISEIIDESLIMHRKNFNIPHLNFDYSTESNLDKVYFYKGTVLVTAKDAAYIAAQSLYDLFGIRLDGYYADIQNDALYGRWNVCFYHTVNNGRLTGSVYDVTVNGDDGSCNRFNIYHENLNRDEIIMPDNYDEMSIDDIILYYYKLFSFREHPEIHEIEYNPNQLEPVYKLKLEDGTYFSMVLDEELRLPRFAFGIYTD